MKVTSSLILYLRGNNLEFGENAFAFFSMLCALNENFIYTLKSEILQRLSNSLPHKGEFPLHFGEEDKDGDRRFESFAQF